MRAVCENIAHHIRHDYCADVVKDMPALMTEEQLQKVMSEAGGKATWIGLVTFLLGPFKSSMLTVPDSAKMVLHPANALLPPVKAEATYEIQGRSAARPF